MAKLVRVLIYEGDEDGLAKHIKTINEGPIGLNGESNMYQCNLHVSVSSIVVEAQDIPCMFCDELTNNRTLICDKCKEESEKFYQLLGL